MPRSRVKSHLRKAKMRSRSIATWSIISGGGVVSCIMPARHAAPGRTPPPARPCANLPPVPELSAQPQKAATAMIAHPAHSFPTGPEGWPVPWVGLWGGATTRVRVRVRLSPSPYPNPNSDPEDSPLWLKPHGPNDAVWDGTSIALLTKARLPSSPSIPFPSRPLPAGVIRRRLCPQTFQPDPPPTARFLIDYKQTNIPEFCPGIRPFMRCERSFCGSRMLGKGAMEKTRSFSEEEQELAPRRASQAGFPGAPK